MLRISASLLAFKMWFAVFGSMYESWFSVETYVDITLMEHKGTPPPQKKN
jgi:hypothetical protein